VALDKVCSKYLGWALNGTVCQKPAETKTKILLSKQRSYYGVAATGIAIIMFIQGKLLLISHNNSPQREDNAPHYFTPNLKHDPYKPG